MSSASEDIVEAAEAKIEASPASALAARMAILAVASALFMQSVDSTALSTALPTLARAFATNPVHLKLCLTAYIMALAVFVPASGWAAGRRSFLRRRSWRVRPPANCWASPCGRHAAGSEPT